MQIDETILELQFFKSEDGFYKSVIEISSDLKNMQIEHDNFEDLVNTQTNDLIWENKQVNKEYLALMRLNFSNLKDKTPQYSKKMEELDTLCKELQSDVEGIDNQISQIKNNELPMVQDVVTSPDNLKKDLKKKNQNLTKTY